MALKEGWPHLGGGGNKLVVVYYLIATEICPHKKSDLIREGLVDDLNTLYFFFYL